MPAVRSAYSENERAIVRRQIKAYETARGFSSARVFLGHVEDMLGRPLGCDDRRLRRFLNDTHRTTDDVVEHLVRFLNIAQAPYAPLAEELARFYSRQAPGGEIHPPHGEKLRGYIAGTYHVYLQGTRSDAPPDEDPAEIGTLEEELARRAPRFDIPYSVLKLDPVPGAPYLAAFEEVGNPDGHNAAPFATEEQAFSGAIVRLIGCLVIQQLGGSYLVVLRRLWEFSGPKIYILGETRNEDPSGPLLTGALIEPNRNWESDLRGTAATIKLVKQPGEAAT